MMKLDRSVLVRFNVLVLSLFLLLSVSSYIILESEIEKFFLFLGLYMVVFSTIVIYVNKLYEKLLDDFNQLREYIDEISLKNYNAIIKIEYFQEFLELSLSLKNIVKRLNTKEKKKK